MISTVISAIFIFFLVLSLLVGLLSSRKKHWITATMITLTSLVACVISALVTNPVTWLIVPPLTSFIEATLGGNIESLAHDVASLEHHLGDIVAMILIPFIYVIIFLLAKLLLDKIIAPLLAKLIVKLADRDKKENGIAEKYEEFKHKEHRHFTIASAAISTLCSLMVLVLALLPFGGMFNYVGQTILSSKENSEDIMLAESLVDNAATNILCALGGDDLYSAMIDHHSDGKEVMITQEAQYVLDFIADFSGVINETTDPEEKANALHAAAADFHDSDVLHEIASDFFNAAGPYWIKGETFDGIERPEIADGCDEIFVCFLECTKDSTPETMAEDFEIALNLMAFYIENEEKFVSTGNPILDLQNKAALVPEIEEIMGDNTRLLPIIDLFI